VVRPLPAEVRVDWARGTASHKRLVVRVVLHGRGETRCRFAESDNYFIFNINDIHIQDTSFYCRIILYQYHDVSRKTINMYFLKIVKLLQGSIVFSGNVMEVITIDFVFFFF